MFKCNVKNSAFAEFVQAFSYKNGWIVSMVYDGTRDIWKVEMWKEEA